MSNRSALAPMRGDKLSAFGIRNPNPSRRIATSREFALTKTGLGSAINYEEESESGFETDYSRSTQNATDMSDATSIDTSVSTSTSSRVGSQQQYGQQTLQQQQYLQQQQQQYVQQQQQQYVQQQQYLQQQQYIQQQQQQQQQQKYVQKQQHSILQRLKPGNKSNNNFSSQNLQPSHLQTTNQNSMPQRGPSNLFSRLQSLQNLNSNSNHVNSNVNIPTNVNHMDMMYEETRIDSDVNNSMYVHNNHYNSNTNNNMNTNNMFSIDESEDGFDSDKHYRNNISMLGLYTKDVLEAEKRAQLQDNIVVNVDGGVDPLIMTPVLSPKGKRARQHAAYYSLPGGGVVGHKMNQNNNMSPASISSASAYAYSGKEAQVISSKMPQSTEELQIIGKKPVQMTNVLYNSNNTTDSTNANTHTNNNMEDLETLSVSKYRKSSTSTTSAVNTPNKPIVEHAKPTPLSQKSPSLHQKPAFLTPNKPLPLTPKKHSVMVGASGIGKTLYNAQSPIKKSNKVDVALQTSVIINTEEESSSEEELVVIDQEEESEEEDTDNETVSVSMSYKRGMYSNDSDEESENETIPVVYEDRAEASSEEEESENETVVMDESTVMLSKSYIARIMEEEHLDETTYAESTSNETINIPDTPMYNATGNFRSPFHVPYTPVEGIATYTNSILKTKKSPLKPNANVRFNNQHELEDGYFETSAVPVTVNKDLVSDALDEFQNDEEDGHNDTSDLFQEKMYPIASPKKSSMVASKAVSPYRKQSIYNVLDSSEEVSLNEVSREILDASYVDHPNTSEDGTADFNYSLDLELETHEVDASVKHSKTPAHPRKRRNTMFRVGEALLERDGKEEGSDLRRSKRMKLPPGEDSWNIRPIFNRNTNDPLDQVTPTVIGYERITTQTPTKEKPKKKRVIKTNNTDTDKLLQIEIKRRDLAGERQVLLQMDATKERVKELGNDREKTCKTFSVQIGEKQLDKLCVKTKQDVTYFRLVQENRENTPMEEQPLVANAFSTTSSLAGILLLPPNTVKVGEEAMEDEIYYIDTCAEHSLQLNINGVNTKLSGGDVLKIPKGNIYALANRSDTHTVKMFYVVGRPSK